VPGDVIGHPVPGGHKYSYRGLVLQVGGLDARLITLLCRKITVKIIVQLPDIAFINLPHINM
jgi:hypothetical protein